MPETTMTDRPFPMLTITLPAAAVTPTTLRVLEHTLLPALDEPHRALVDAEIRRQLQLGPTEAWPSADAPRAGDIGGAPR